MTQSATGKFSEDFIDDFCSESFLLVSPHISILFIVRLTHVLLTRSSLCYRFTPFLISSFRYDRVSIASGVPDAGPMPILCRNLFLVDFPFLSASENSSNDFYACVKRRRYFCVNRSHIHKYVYTYIYRRCRFYAHSFSSSACCTE